MEKQFAVCSSFKDLKNHIGKLVKILCRILIRSEQNYLKDEEIHLLCEISENEISPYFASSMTARVNRKIDGCSGFVLLMFHGQPRWFFLNASELAILD